MDPPNINVTPLIDVLLVLLIIFMVAKPADPRRFEARIPDEPKLDGSQPNPQTIVVTITRDLEIKINDEGMLGTVVDLDPTAARLRTIFEERAANSVYERTVFIKAPLNVEYGTVTKVIDAVKTAGALPIALQIDRLE